MLPVKEILNTIINRYKDILQSSLVGIYLHGSLAMNCFNHKLSDIDFLVVVKEKPDFKAMRQLIDVLLQLSKDGPQKGIEMSVLLESDTKAFKYPTPFVLHYSEAHKEKYIHQLEYICGGFEDPDLAAHITITQNRGICLYGKPISQVFQLVPAKYYIDSIIGDISSSKLEIANNPIYYILNLCRVLVYLKEGVVCSKKEGGEWGCSNLPQNYVNIVESALISYTSACAFLFTNSEQLKEFADFMLKEIDIYSKVSLAEKQ